MESCSGEEDGELRERLALARESDEALEEAIGARLPLKDRLDRLMPILGRRVGARAVHVRTHDEDLELADFRWPPETEPLALGDLAARLGGAASLAEGARLARRLDVAGRSFGLAALVLPEAPDDREARRLDALLRTWCEVIDNDLASIAEARVKHRLTRRISAALRTPSLDAGVEAAIHVLREAIGCEDVVLVYRHEEELAEDAWGAVVVRGGRTVHGAGRSDDEAMRSLIARSAPALLRGDGSELLQRLGIASHREEAIVAGVQRRELLGRLVLARADGAGFNTFDRDLIERFTDFLRQRLVDFNREWRWLKHSFSRSCVRRLLAEEDYRERWLAPVEREAAILFADIAGFTRVSERVLREPPLIGALINAWSRRVVDVVWDTGGVFDKLVGDCAIALWGPPFFELTGREACGKALEAARRIRDLTQSLVGSGELPELAASGERLSVATGLHFAPLFVGLIGPNRNYTGFSSGMNSTARLQGLAEAGEILAMEPFVNALGAAERFGELRTARAKNVAEPLRFHALLG